MSYVNNKASCSFCFGVLMVIAQNRNVNRSLLKITVFDELVTQMQPQLQPPPHQNRNGNSVYGS